ncbi:MAG: hypothetical protein BGN86_06565 [Caulobacterales bacterium 68-7]|nr:hypothetical protein [Caulobacterales bacterium]OJU12805.1 MAG: hypothetical protein BGN86_06565 [Caulobacterales bacterium 68-7]
MQIAIQHPKPGVASPPGAVIALTVIGVMGLYGFTTALQKSTADRRDSIAAVRGDDSVRLASAVAQTPSLIYAVSDSPPPSVQAVRRTLPPKPPEPEIAAEPTPVALAVVTPTEAPAAPVIEAASASAAGVAVSAVEPVVPDPAPRP